MPQVGLIVLLSIAHFITDINQGALPAFLPFFISEYGLSYTAAAAIVFATNSASAVIQPVFGHFSDRFGNPWLLPISLVMAGLGLGLTGLVSNYGLIIGLTVFSGIGIAAFHPQTARLVNFAAGNRKGTFMSFFGLGGTLGFAVGPVLGTTALITFGLTGTSVLILPVSLAAIVLVFLIPRLRKLEQTQTLRRENPDTTTGQDHWRAFSLLSAVIMGRSVIFFGLITFIPLYWTGYYQRSVAEGGVALSVLTISGVIGNFFGGWISDRIGRKKTILLGFSMLIVLLPVFVSISNPVLGFLLLIPIGFAHSSTYSPSIVMGQEYLPNHIGFSSGVTLGIAVAFGGMMAPLIGRIADTYGIWYSLALLAALPPVIIPLAALLPGIKQKSAAIPPSTSAAMSD